LFGRAIAIFRKDARAMAHLLASLTGAKPEDLKKTLRADAQKHAEHGLYLEHVWKSVDDANVVLFLFRTTDLGHARQFVEDAHAQARRDDPNANLPRMTFLSEV